MNRVIKIFICLIVGTSLFGQQEEETSNFWGLGFNYGMDFPVGDLSDRFGQNFHAGLSIELFRTKLNGMLRLEGLLFFGDNVNEDVLSEYRTSSGALLGNNGSYADVFLRQRGLYLGVLANKVLIKNSSNPHSGLALGMGLGILQHNIRLQVDSQNAPQFTGDYAKGYDRYSRGPALKQNLSYLHVGKNRAMNYEIALTFIEGFTQNVRKVNFDNGEITDSGRRLDVMIGLDLKWILPIKDQRKPEDIYY